MRYRARTLTYFDCEDTPVVWDAWDQKVQLVCDTLAEAEKSAGWFNEAQGGRPRTRRRSRIDEYLQTQSSAL